MTRILIIQSGAEADLTDAALGYQEQRFELAMDFMKEADAAIARIVTNPRLFPSLRRKPDVRRALMKRFPYRIFFVLRADAIVVFRVLHGARHDRSWEHDVPAQ